MISFIALATVLGLSAGLAPGPLFTLVISETLQHDVKAGIRIAVAPIITDLPIIGATLFLASRLGQSQQILGIISLTGGCLLLYMGYQGIKTSAVELNLKPEPARSLGKGILVNALSPHPYLFWLTVGAPINTRALEHGVLTVVVFLSTFYLLLVGSKVTLAILVARSKTLLCGRQYLYIMRSLGLVLTALAFTLFYDGMVLLQLVK